MKEKYNVIWFMADQMRGDVMGNAGDPNVRTPNLDRISENGVNFKNAVSGFPLCCPSRGAFLTGLYPHKVVPGHQCPLSPDVTTIADYFNAAEYHTAWLGKWHLAGFQECEGRAAFCDVQKDMRGRFKTWIGYENNNSQFDCWVHGHKNEKEVGQYRLPGFETDSLTDLLLDEIREHQNENFFLSVSVQPPHNPYTAPSEWMKNYTPANIQLKKNVPDVAHVRERAKTELAGYYALIENVDYNVGRVMNLLRELELDKNTFLVFFSDHGDQHGSHGHFYKMTPYQEAIHIPHLIWGGTSAAYQDGKKHSSAVTNHVDMLPTALGLAGLKVPDHLPGFDYSYLAKSQKSSQPEPIDAYLQSVIPTKHSYSYDLPWRGLLTRDKWKYVAIEGQPMALYDLNTDPLELINLAYQSHMANKRKELNDRLKNWIIKTEDDFKLPTF